MKEYCVDLEIAKQLKENGFPQLFSDSRDCYYNDPKLETGYGNIYYFAPSSDEILKELPHEINGYILEIIRYENGTFEADYARSLWREEDVEYLIKSKKLFYNLSPCLAELWLDLKKEGYIK